MVSPTGTSPLTKVMLLPGCAAQNCSVLRSPTAGCGGGGGDSNGGGFGSHLTGVRTQHTMARHHTMTRHFRGLMTPTASASDASGIWSDTALRAHESQTEYELHRSRLAPQSHPLKTRVTWVASPNQTCMCPLYLLDERRMGWEQ